MILLWPRLRPGNADLVRSTEVPDIRQGFSQNLLGLVSELQVNLQGTPGNSMVMILHQLRHGGQDSHAKRAKQGQTKRMRSKARPSLSQLRPRQRHPRHALCIAQHSIVSQGAPRLYLRRRNREAYIALVCRLLHLKGEST
jgi:hypothetical protein